MLNIDGLVDERGHLNNEGQKVLASLLGHLPEVHQGMWGEAFVPMVSKLVRVCVDLAVVKDRKVLLKWRKDEFFEGWEMPGGSLGPGESWEDAGSRFAKEEFGMEVRFVKRINTFNNTDNPRAHDVTVLLLCEPRSEPKEGQWFGACPEKLIAVHRKYWWEVEQYLR